LVPVHNFVQIDLPDERAGGLVILLDKEVDGGLQIDDGMKYAVFSTATCELSEKRSMALSHGHVVETKWKVQRGCLVQ
jgi:hypothetical protein